MEQLKRILRALLFPPAWLAALIVFPAMGWVIYNLAAGQTETWQAYASYGLSAYGLVLICVRVPGIVRAFRTGFAAHPGLMRVVESPQVQRYRSDADYRARLSLSIGLGINLCNAALQAVMGVTQHSLWFGALAGYYLLLTLMRMELAWYAWRNAMGQEPVREWKRYMTCGVILLLMNQALGVVVALVVHRGDGFSYPGITVYVMAMYAFYAVIHAAMNMNKLRKQHSPVLEASGMVSLMAALVSMLSLETAMLNQFGGENDPMFHRLMTGITGGVVCVLVLGAAVYMIHRAWRKMKDLKTEA